MLMPVSHEAVAQGACRRNCPRQHSFFSQAAYVSTRGHPSLRHHMDAPFDPHIRRVLHRDGDTIQQLEKLARQELGDTPFILWEGDPATFQFSFVGGDAEKLLGYPAGDWVSSPTFWTSTVIHSEDREEAVAYCALATALCRDHVFEYRALTRAFDMIWLKDYVHVVRGPRDRPVSLRGIMIDISEEKWRDGTFLKAATYRAPSTRELEAVSRPT